jgi:hypothetical protein
MSREKLGRVDHKSFVGLAHVFCCCNNSVLPLSLAFRVVDCVVVFSDTVFLYVFHHLMNYDALWDVCTALRFGVMFAFRNL